MGGAIFFWDELNDAYGPFNVVEAAIAATRLAVKTQLVVTDEATHVLEIPAATSELREQRATFCLPLQASDPDVVMAIREMRTEGVVVLQIFESTRLAHFRPHSSRISIEDLYGILLRSGRTAEESVAGLWSELSQLNSVIIEDHVAAVSQQILRDPGFFDLNTWIEKVRDIQQSKESLSTLTSTARRIESGPTSIIPTLTEMNRSLDGLSGSILMHQLFILNQQTAVASKEMAEQEQRVLERDRRLASWGAALLLPSLWFGLIGTNVVPSDLFGMTVPSLTAFLGTLAVGLALVPAGLRATKRLLRSKNQHGN